MKTDTLYDLHIPTHFEAPIQKTQPEAQVEDEEATESREWDTTTLDFGDGKPLIITFPIRD